MGKYRMTKKWQKEVANDSIDNLWDVFTLVIHEFSKIDSFTEEYDELHEMKKYIQETITRNIKDTPK